MEVALCSPCCVRYESYPKEKRDDEEREQMSILCLDNLGCGSRESRITGACQFRHAE